MAEALEKSGGPVVSVRQRLHICWLAAIVLTALTACSMVGSNPLNISKMADCETELGAYHMARDYVRIVIAVDDKASSNDPKSPVTRISATRISRPDTRRGYCLDFLASAFARDVVRIARHDGMLVEVGTQIRDNNKVAIASSQDQTLFIAGQVIDQAFVGITGQSRDATITGKGGAKFKAAYDNQAQRRVGGTPAFTLLDGAKDEDRAGLKQPTLMDGGELKNEPKNPSDFTSDKWPTDQATYQQSASLLEIEYDPTDPHEAAASNLSLKDQKYCVILNDGKIDPRDSDDYCDEPIAFVRRKFGQPATRSILQATEYVKSSPGVLYQPRRSHELYIFKKFNVARKGGWTLQGQQTIGLVNEAPLMAVAVDRTVFADRNTVLKFEAGALTSVSIDKDSELLGASKIIFSTVESIVLLPTAVLQVRLRNETNMRDLLDANAKILTTKKDILDLKQKTAAKEKATAEKDRPVPPDVILRLVKALEECDKETDPARKARCKADAQAAAKNTKQ